MATTHTFTIHDQHRLNSSTNAAIRRPREITYFSYDNYHKYHANASSLRYYYPPSLPADLNSGFSQFRNLDDTADDHLDSLLCTLIDHERAHAKKLDADLVTWRGMMTKIMTAPFSHLDSWEMNATRFDGTVFVEENREHKLRTREEQYQAIPSRGAMSQDLMSYWGYKFETLATLPRHWCHCSRAEIDGRETEQVSNYAQYCSVVRTGFGSTKVILGGEVDAVNGTKPEEIGVPVDWIELKTTAELINEKEEVKFERKLLKFWAQSFLLGVPKIVVGFRDQQGWLRRVQCIDTQGIPEKVTRSGRRLWDGQTCINFTAAFLDWLKLTIVSDGVWKIRKREKNPVLEVFKVEETGIGDILSEDFIRWRTLELPTLLARTSPAEPSAHNQDSSELIPESQNGTLHPPVHPP